MVELTRQIRFSLPPEGSVSDAIDNSWAGWPSTTGLAPFLAIDCRLTGEVDPVLGYVCNVKDIDRLMREKVIAAAIARSEPLSSERLIQFAFSVLKDAFAPRAHLKELELHLTPYLKMTVNADNESMLLVTHQFEFSASHRLHNPDLSAERNRELYGKCNNPHGHGHNYVVDVTVIGEPDGTPGGVIPVERIEQIVKQTVIDPLDHKYLNIEVEDFQQLNPSVENIAVVIWRWLDGKLAPARLQRIRVYETPKTWADYCG